MQTTRCNKRCIQKDYFISEIYNEQMLHRKYGLETFWPVVQQKDYYVLVKN